MIKRAAGPDGSIMVTFVVRVDERDRPVSVVGDFNAWDPLANPLRKRSNGTRSAVVQLEAGRSYRFKYLADGDDWFLEADVGTTQADDRSAVDSLLEL